MCVNRHRSVLHSLYNSIWLLLHYFLFTFTIHVSVHSFRIVLHLNFFSPCWFSFLCVSLPFSILQIIPHHLILLKLSPHHLPFLMKKNSVTLCRGLLKFPHVGLLPLPSLFSLSIPPPHLASCTHRRLEHSLSLQVRFQCLLPYIVFLGKFLISQLLQPHTVYIEQVTPRRLTEIFLI